MEEMIDLDDDVVANNNETASEHVKRQAEFPGNPEEDKTKYADGDLNLVPM